MASDEQPEWIFLRTFEAFEEEGTEDLNGLYTNVVHLIQDYQIRARPVESHAETLKTNLSNTEATIVRMRQHRDIRQHQLTNHAAAPPPPHPHRHDQPIRPHPQEAHDSRGSQTPQSLTGPVPPSPTSP